MDTLPQSWGAGGLYEAKSCLSLSVWWAMLAVLQTLVFIHACHCTHERTYIFTFLCARGPCAYAYVIRAHTCVWHFHWPMQAEGSLQKTQVRSGLSALGLSKPAFQSG